MPAVSSQTAMSNYKSQLNNRFYSNSISLEVLVCLVLIFILVIQIVKFFKKTYEWQTEYETKIDVRHTEESRSILAEKSKMQTNDARTDHKKKEEEGPKSRGQRLKKEVYVPTLVRVEEIIKNKIPQVAIIAINVAMIASYEYCAIASYISVVIIVISEIGSQHAKLKLGLEIISKLLLVTLYINMMTVPKPSYP